MNSEMWSGKKRNLYSPLGLESDWGFRLDHAISDKGRLLIRREVSEAFYQWAGQLLQHARTKNYLFTETERLKIKYNVPSNMSQEIGKSPFRISHEQLDASSGSWSNVTEYTLYSPSTLQNYPLRSLTREQLVKLEKLLLLAQAQLQPEKEPTLQKEIREFFRRIFFLLTGDTFAPGNKKNLK